MEQIRAVPPEFGDDEARIMASARGDANNFAPLYERYFPRVYAYCLRRTGRPEEAEDLTSAIFTRALAGLSGYRGGSVGAWLFRIAHNVVANHWRSHRHDLPLDPAVHTVSSAGDGGEAIVTRLVQAEERQRVARLIAALPEQQQEILQLTIHGELSAKEVGAIVGKSEGAIWVALHRITRRLRRAYEESEKEYRS